MLSFTHRLMGGWATNMKKNKLGTLLLVFITIGLLGAVIYFSMLLSNHTQSSVTQIKKTKASAQTYHALLALNVTGTLSPTDIPQDSTSNSSSSVSSSVAQLPNVSPTQPLLAYSSTSPTAVPTKTISPTAQPTSKPIISPTDTPVDTLIPIPTKAVTAPSPTSTLLVYRTIAAVTPTGSSLVSPTQVLNQPTGVTNKQLPETGWVQLSTILFIVAATTVFISFLF